MATPLPPRPSASADTPATGNRAGVPSVSPGQRTISAASLNALADATNRAMTQPSGGGFGMSSPYGNLIEPGRARKTASVSHPLKVIRATKEGAAAAVTVVDGTVSRMIPTLGGVAITASPKPALGVTASGFVVLVTTWQSDFIPRSYPLSAEFIFVAGDPEGEYVFADTLTESRMVHARVWATVDGAKVTINKLLTTPGGNITVLRNSYNATTHEFVALRA